MRLSGRQNCSCDAIGWEDAHWYEEACADNDNHSRPKPSELQMASVRRSRSFTRLEYWHSSSVLKHVCEVGSLLLSSPSRCSPYKSRLT